MQRKIKPKALKIALDAFRADPSLGTRQGKSLFSEILGHLNAGMNDEAVLQEILKKNRPTTLPTGTLTLF
jgi:hypothetical protein